MKKVNLVFGRFQPFTQGGHYKCIKEAWQHKHVPTVICMIDVPDSKVDKRHPFPSSMLLPLYKEWFDKDPMIETIITVKRADPVLVHEQLGDTYEIVSVTCGTDRFDSYQWMYKYKDQAHLSDDFEIIEVKRTDEDASATKARQALLDNDKAAFFKLTPLVPLATRLKTDIFTELRDQILKVYE